MPNIPGREEVEANGYQVGQMTNKLLEKVEEMTLYIIELKEENKKLIERMNKLELTNNKVDSKQNH